jgi:ATP-dependent protease ClpP protease subunit
MNLESHKRNNLDIDIYRRTKRKHGNTEEEIIEGEDILLPNIGKLLGREEDVPSGKFNHIYFDEDINKHSCRKLIGKIEELNIKLGKLECDYDIDHQLKIYLHINSLGGSVFSAFSVIDTMRRSKYPIVTIIEGASASAATLISVCGHERWITRHGYMLIHQLSSGCWGKMTEIVDEYDNLVAITEHIYKIYEDKTHIKKRQLRKLLKHDRWWGADTCLEKGLVDKII